MRLSILLLVLATSSIIFQSSAQQFPCDGKLYFFRNYDGENWLSYIDQYTTANPVVVNLCALTDASISGMNAMGANPVDHFIYFTANRTLWQIDANCTLTAYCPNLPNTDMGCFDNLGRYWFVSGTSLEAYDVNSCALVKGPFTITPLSGSADIAFSVADCHFYMGSKNSVIEIDTNGVTVNTYSTGFGGGGTADFGGFAIGSDGNLYGMPDVSATGSLYKYNVTTHTGSLDYTFTGGTGNPCGCDMASFACSSLNSNFTASPVSACFSSPTIQFNNTSSGLVNKFAWDFGDGTKDTVDYNPSHTYTSPGNYTVKLSVSALANCLYVAPDTFSTNVQIFPLPVAAITGDTEICYGTSSILSASGGTSYLWSTGETTTSITVSPLSNTSYSVTATDVNGCSANNAQAVNVNPLPVVAISGNATLCLGQSSILTASGGTGYLWSTGETTTSITVSPDGNTSYSVTATDVNGCSAGNVQAVTVNPLPTVTASALGNTAICEGGSVQICTNSIFNSYIWSNGVTAQCVTAMNPAPYTVTATDQNGCTGTSNIVSVTVGLPPTLIINADGPTTFCAGDSVVLTASGADSAYVWAPTAETTASITVKANGTYSVTGINKNACSGVSTQAITVNPLPVVSFAPFSSPVCVTDAPFILTGGSAAGGTYSGTGVSGNTFNPASAGTGSYTLTYSYTDANGCSNSAVTSITVNPAATVSIAPIPALCSSSTAYTLSGTPEGGTFSGKGVTGNTFDPSVAGVGTDTITYTYTNSSDCVTGTSASTTVTVYTSLAVTITGSPTIRCDLNTIYLGYGPQFITLTANSNGTASSYQWYRDGIAIQGATADTVQVNTDGNYNVVITDVGGCTSDSANTTVFKLNVVDIRCGHDLKKVILCHVPPGNPDNPQTLCIAPEAVAAHLAHHPLDCLGPCSFSKKRLAETSPDNVSEEGTEFNVFPNPFSDKTVIEFTVPESGNATLELYDINGALVSKLFDGEVTGGAKYQFTVDGSNLTEGIYISVLRTNGGVMHEKLMVTK